MKKDFLKSMLFMLCAVFTFNACSDDDDDKGGQFVGGFSKDVPVVYANGEAASDAKTLTLSYEGSLYGDKIVTFTPKSENMGELTFRNMFPAEAETVIPVNIVKTEDGTGYSFSGTATNGNMTAFAYEGMVSLKGMTLNLNNIKLADNVLAKQGKWFGVPYDAAESKSMIAFDVTATAGNEFWESLIDESLSSLAGQLLSQYLKIVTFHDNGVITACYKGETDWVDSPKKPLATYVVKGNDVYVLPNVAAIKEQVEADKNREAGMNPILSLMLQEIQRWTTTGVHFTLQTNEDGTVSLTLGDDELKVLRTQVLPQVKPLILQLIESNPDLASLKDFVSAIIDCLITATDFTVTVNLQKEEPASSEALVSVASLFKGMKTFTQK